MAVLRMDYRSDCLARTVSLTAVIPVEKQQGNPKPFKTLYMLHGLGDNDTSLLYNTLIVRYACAHGIALVCPEGDNHYYVDCQETGERYGVFVGEEVVELTRRLFPLSPAREDTFIGGISMGGYGAFIAGLQYDQTFGGIISLGTGVRYKHLVDSDLRPDAPFIFDRPGMFVHIHGDLDKVAESDMHIEHLLLKKKAEGIAFPRMYMGCGKDDVRVPEERELARFIQSNGIDVTYREVPGGHDSCAWDQLIPDALNWWAPESE